MFIFGDFGFNYYLIMGQYFGFFLYYFVDDEVFFIDVVVYGIELEGLYEDFVEFFGEYGVDLDFFEFKDVVEIFKFLVSEMKIFELFVIQRQDVDLIQVVNYKYCDFQWGFVLQDGFFDCEFYKYVVIVLGFDIGKFFYLSMLDI